jgi:cytochrome c5
MKRVLACAFVCVVAASIAWPDRVLSHGSITTTVLFDREIVRVLNDHCVMCHMEQGLAFPLETYEQTWLSRQAMRTSVLRRHMPPWAAVPGYGTFANANSLTSRESQFVTSWVEGLGPRNAGKVFLNVANATPSAEQVRATAAHISHWRVEPDVRVQLPPRTVPARQADSIVNVTVDLKLGSARGVRALEYMPGDRRVLRAAVFTLQQTSQWLGSWTPWSGFVTAPQGAAFRLPANARVVAQLHYRGTSENVIDRGTLGLSFAPQGLTQTISDVVLREASAARASNGPRTAHATTRLAARTFVWALVPRVAAGLASVQVTARTPDGGTNILLFARNPPVEWPTPYILARPVLLPAGTELSASARYDNTPPADPVLLTVSRFAP